ncbi:DEAD/DEAH box helicase [Mariniluteicoccus endophyticus]
MRSKLKAGGKKKSAPKSFKADGTPKKRWSPAERAERGHSPRRGGGQPRSFGRRDDRSSNERSFDRRDDRSSNERSYDRRDDRSSNERSYDRRDDRGARNTDRGGRNFPSTRGDRGFNRDDRGDRGFRRDDRASRDDRRGGHNRDERGYNRDDRGYNRDDRGYNRDDRRQRRDFKRDDRFEDRGAGKPYAARPAHTAPRPDRAGARPEPKELRRSFRDDERDHKRDDRGFNREDRGAKREFNRDDRGFNRDDRGFNRNDRGPKREFNRDDRGPKREFNRDDRRDNDANDADQMSWAEAEAIEVDESTVSDDAGFAELGLPKSLVGALDQQGITSPFPIQAATIPDALTGRDVLGRGQTGSGKTLGFGLPLLARLSANGPGQGAGRAPRAVILVPTRELALQVADVVSPLAKVVGLSVTLICGGMAFGPQLKAFDRGVDVVVATPGRLIDLMEQGAANLSEVEITVLDEADHMADLGFLPAVTTILDAVPAEGQRLLFSATLDRGIDRIVKQYLHDPVIHEVDSDRASVETMEHRVLHVLPHDKNAMTAAIANREGRTVVFVRTQRGADRIAGQLRDAGVMAGALHGGLTQGARARILNAFKEGTVPVLVATDVAARGIHVDEVSLVLQVDPPMGPKDYLHRAGRTARAGGTGVVASIVLPHQRREMQRLTKQAGVAADPIEIRPSDDRLFDLTGARTPEAEAISEAEYAAVIAPPKPQRKARPQGGRGGKWEDRKGYGKRGGGFNRGQGRRPRD